MEFAHPPGLLSDSFVMQVSLEFADKESMCEALGRISAFSESKTKGQRNRPTHDSRDRRWPN
jgi:hypothetical protein